jgi:hypothetical protein
VGGGGGLFAAVKLDMSKAYDRVEWCFLEKMMYKLDFCEEWVNTIMKCVTTVKYRIKVNGGLTEEIIPERGLHRGIPSRCICSCYVPKLFLVYSMRLRRTVNWWE